MQTCDDSGMGRARIAMYSIYCATYAPNKDDGRASEGRSTPNVAVESSAPMSVGSGSGGPRMVFYVQSRNLTLEVSELEAFARRFILVYATHGVRGCRGIGGSWHIWRILHGGCLGDAL